MEKTIIWKKCKYCLGFGVNVKKHQYVEWEKEFNALVSSISKRRKSIRKNIKALRTFLEQIVENSPPCSFCEGEGGCPCS